MLDLSDLQLSNTLILYTLPLEALDLSDLRKSLTEFIKTEIQQADTVGVVEG